jgi:hypothetical protein
MASLRRKSVGSVSTKRVRKSVAEDVGREVKQNLPLTRFDPVGLIMTRAKDLKMEKPMKKVSILDLLRYSNTKERILMAIGLLFAAISGLGLPVWLVRQMFSL